MLAARNRHYRVAAAAAGISWLLLAVFKVIELTHLAGLTVRGGYIGSAAVFVAVYLVGACGWLLIAAAFGSEIDWWRLRLGAVVVAGAYVLYIVAWLERLLAVFSETHDGDYRGYYLASAIATSLIAAGSCVAASGLGERRRGAPRASRLWLGAILLVAAYAAITVGALCLQSFYADYHAVHEATIGMLVVAVGAFVTALAGSVFVRGVKRPFAAREASVATAGAVAVVGTALVAAGEALLAVGYSRHGGLGWQQTIAWLAVAARLSLVAAFVALTLGARAARDGSDLDVGGAA